MKTKEEAYEKYIANEAGMFHLTIEVFSAGWDAATANHDKEMVEFGKYCQHHRYTSPKTALITFRQSNGG